MIGGSVTVAVLVTSTGGKPCSTGLHSYRPYPCSLSRLQSYAALHALPLCGPAGTVFHPQANLAGPPAAARNGLAVSHTGTAVPFEFYYRTDWPCGKPPCLQQRPTAGPKSQTPHNQTYVSTAAHCASCFTYRRRRVSLRLSRCCAPPLCLPLPATDALPPPALRRCPPWLPSSPACRRPPASSPSNRRLRLLPFCTCGSFLGAASARRRPITSCCRSHRALRRSLSGSAAVRANSSSSSSSSYGMCHGGAWNSCATGRRAGGGGVSHGW